MKKVIKHKQTKLKNALLASLMAFGLAACFDMSDTTNVVSEPTQTIYDIVESEDRFAVLKAALDQEGLDTTLDEAGQYTVFAPTNTAFDNLANVLGLDMTTDLLSNPDLDVILKYHVLIGENKLSDVQALIAGGPVAVETFESRDLVLSSSDNVYTNLSIIIETDIDATNGVIHVIDTVLLPPSANNSSDSLTDVLTNKGNFTQLLGFLTNSDVQTAINSALNTAIANDTLTLFAPTDAAFTNLVNALVADSSNDLNNAGEVVTFLTANNAENLIAILLDHVILNAQVNSQAALLASGTNVDVAGASLPLTIENKQIKINQSLVSEADVFFDGGVIHVIDSVIIE